MEILKWLEQWYASHCNGDWEHNQGVRIYTLDNPGWTVEINLRETALEHRVRPSILTEVDDNDWYAYSIEDSVFKAAGDPGKLQFLLELFRTIVIEHTPQSSATP